MRSVFIAAVILGLGLPAAGAADPDQVLVLYNSDYGIDQYDSDLGQDSKEVAEYYVRRHTDPRTGKRPYILGLHCIHGKGHLNTFRVPESSKDNYFGLEYTGDETAPKNWPVADSRHVDILVGKAEAERLDLKSVTIALGKTTDRAAATVVFQDGKASPDLGIKHGPTKEGGYNWQLDARKFSPGIVRLWLEAKDKQGHRAKKLRRVYRDFGNFRVSTTGRDGIRDDKNYREDIELPIKWFLEDPRNSLPDGTLLKDHILYIVVCHGLPKAVESMYGICRGATDFLGDYGDGSSLQQRLMTLYFDVTTMDFVYVPSRTGMRKTSVPNGAKARFSKYTKLLRRDKDGVQPKMICNTLSFGLAGQFNPYQHPKVYEHRAPGKLADIYDQQKYRDPHNRLAPLYPQDARADLPPHFSSKLRRRWPRQSYLYWAMRIDGPTPAIAKAQVDAAIYAGRYLTPQMGTCYNRLKGPLTIQPSVRLGIDELKDLGFKLQPTLNDPPKVIERPLILSAYFGDGPKYYDEGEIAGYNGVLPGGIVYGIKSLNRWKRNDDQFGTYFHKMIEAGATVTAGLGAHGGAHITSASWWDDRILFHHLFRGYDLGESLLMSSIHLDWVIAYVGDPLYRPNVPANKPDTTSPAVDADGLTVDVLRAKDSYCAVLTAPLRQTPANPEMAEISVVYSTPGQPEQSSRNWRFSARPRVILNGLTPGAGYNYVVTLTDAYGNATKVPGSLNVSAAPPSKLRHEEIIGRGKKAMAIAVSRYWKKDDPPALVSRAGEIEIEFTPMKKKFTLVSLHGLRWTSEKLSVGGGTAKTHEPLKFEVGRRYRIVARWRRRPITREVHLIAPDGAEFLAASNNLVPWPMRLGGGEAEYAIWGTARFGARRRDVQIHTVRIYDNANPAPDDRRRPYVKKFRMAEFEAAVQTHKP